MLRVDDYEQYETGRRFTFTMPQYLLRNWAHYEQNVSSLDDAERANAKHLYTALGYLTKEERIFLADKYRVTLPKNRGYTKRQKLDKELAAERGMKQSDYAKLRRGVELKFLHYLKQEEGDNGC